MLFTYLHLAPVPELAQGLVESGATCIAYETVEDRQGRLPLLAPMSEIAGKLATQSGAFMLEKPMGGRGMLLGGVPGVSAANVMVIGGGVVGLNAADHRDRNAGRRLRLRLSIDATARARVDLRRARVDGLQLDALRSSRCCRTVDLVIGAVLVHGAKAPARDHARAARS